jgi:hypothetical protein
LTKQGGDYAVPGIGMNDERRILMLQTAFDNLARVGIKHGDLLYAALKITAYSNHHSARFLQALVNLPQTSLLARREMALFYELYAYLKRKRFVANAPGLPPDRLQTTLLLLHKARRE